MTIDSSAPPGPAPATAPANADSPLDASCVLAEMAWRYLLNRHDLAAAVEAAVPALDHHQLVEAAEHAARQLNQPGVARRDPLGRSTLVRTR